MKAATEEWRPIPGYGDSYEVSDLGRVRTRDRIILDSLGRQQPRAGQVMRPQKDKHGRWSVLLSDRSRRRRFHIAPLVLQAFVGPRPAGQECCHNNGDATDDRLVNLRWDTKSGNMMDKVRHGTHHNAIKTHCPRGHRLEHPNLCVASARNGHRQCRSCHLAYMKNRRTPVDLAILADEIYERISVA